MAQVQDFDIAVRTQPAQPSAAYQALAGAMNDKGKHSKATDGHQNRSTNSLKNGKKDRLHRLDIYLGALEGALVRGESTLSPSLAAHLVSSVQGITAGMLITDALDVIFAEQEGC